MRPPEPPGRLECNAAKLRTCNPIWEPGGAPEERKAGFGCWRNGNNTGDIGGRVKASSEAGQSTNGVLSIHPRLQTWTLRGV